MNKHEGTRFEEWLKEEGIFDEVEALATKKIIAYDLQKAIEEKKISKSEMARRMRTSRKSLDRLLDPENLSVTLITMEKAAHALDKKLSICLT